MFPTFQCLLNALDSKLTVLEKKCVFLFWPQMQSTLKSQQMLEKQWKKIQAVMTLTGEEEVCKTTRRLPFVELFMLTGS